MHLTPAFDAAFGMELDMTTFSPGAGVERASSADSGCTSPVGEDGPMCDEFEVTDATDAGRFELRRAGELVGFASYRPRDRTVVVAHVETLAPHRGQGYASRLMAGIVGILRRDGRTIEPRCPFAATYLRERPRDADVLHRT